MRRLVKDGLLIPDQNQPWLDLADTDTLDALNAASTPAEPAIDQVLPSAPLTWAHRLVLRIRKRRLERLKRIFLPLTDG